MRKRFLGRLHVSAGKHIVCRAPFVLLKSSTLTDRYHYFIPFLKSTASLKLIDFSIELEPHYSSTELRSFMGMIYIFRPMISSFAFIAYGVSEILRFNLYFKQLVWNDCHYLFQKLETSAGRFSHLTVSLN